MKKKHQKKHFKKYSKKKPSTRKRLEEATAAYFASLSGEVLEEENRLGVALASAAVQVDFDAD
jgi:hypothetical protein